MLRKNTFIVVEGLDGAGKTTVARHLSNKIGGIYLYSISQLFEPIKIPIDREENSLLRYLYYITSLVALQHDIENALRKGNLILDRYIDSTLLYHAAIGVDIDIVDRSKLNLREPDYIFVIQVLIFINLLLKHVKINTQIQ